MIFIDAHVHIHRDFSLEHLLTAARENFSQQLPAPCPDRSRSFFLCLAEAAGCNAYNELRNRGVCTKGLSAGNWRFSCTAEAESLRAVDDRHPQDQIIILAGRQIITKEKLEVLALATTVEIAEARPLAETIRNVQDTGGLAVIPWGAGKWLGKRGKIVEAFLNNANSDQIFMGDNGGRPNFWPTPSPFILAAARGIHLLSGSDPLPLPGEELRVGSYGTMIDGECSSDRPSGDLKNLLATSGHNLAAFGSRPGVWRFFRNQMALRLQ